MICCLLHPVTMLRSYPAWAGLSKQLLRCCCVSIPPAAVPKLGDCLWQSLFPKQFLMEWGPFIPFNLTFVFITRICERAIHVFVCFCFMFMPVYCMIGSVSQNLPTNLMSAAAFAQLLKHFSEKCSSTLAEMTLVCHSTYLFETI